MMRNRAGVVGTVGACMLLASSASLGHTDQSAEIAELQRQAAEQAAFIQRQQATIQHLVEQVARLETSLGAAPAAPPASEPAGSASVSLEADELQALPQTVARPDTPVKIRGYIDIGYVDAAGSGTVSSNSIHINSRGDTLSSVGLDGDSTLLINEVNLDFTSQLSDRFEVFASLDLLPRDLSFTTSGGTASTDAFEVDLAYLAYQPFPPTHPLESSLFGDLTLYLGKFISPLGLEYRYNESPDRVNISSSHHAVYTTGNPAGIKARGKLFERWLREFRRSVFAYNIVLANDDPYIATHRATDLDDNGSRSIMGRLSYGLDALPGAFVETGVSLGTGARVGQGDNDAKSELFVLDTRLERGPLTLRAEWDYADEDRPRAGGSALVFAGVYFEGFYEVSRPAWLPGWIPLRSLTPYYRYDTRNLNLTPVTGSASVIDVNRHTFALRHVLRPGTLLKWEYQLVGEAEGASVNDDSFLMSFVQSF